jgi:hypothetical protein
MEAIVLRGTPTEVADFFRQAPAFRNAQVAEIEEETPPGQALPADVAEWAREWKVRPSLKDYLQKLITEVGAWEGARLSITSGREGSGKRFAGRIRFVKEGERQMFGFLGHRGLLLLRLPKTTDLTRFPNASARSGKSKKFGVQLYVRSPESFEDARALLRLAYEA